MSTELAAFEPHRPRLLRIAYRMLGTMSDAEDVVQDAYLRWHETDRSAVRVVEALLVKTVVRLAIDRQRRLKAERASYHGSWLPEPWSGAGSVEQVERADDMSYAALVLLERLSADERAALLLREVFDLDYGLIADTLEKSEAACRKLVQRARERLDEARDGEPASEPVSRESQRALLRQLVAATRAQNATELEQLLAQAVEMVSDGGGKVFAARYVLQGAGKVANTLWRFVRKGGPSIEEHVVDLYGEPAIVTYVDGALFRATFVASRGAQVQTLYMLLNPDKLRRLASELAREGRA